MMKRQKGFTLIELLVVIAIIGFLAAALLVGINPLEQTRKAQDAGKLSKCKEAIGAAERYYAFHNADPASLTCSSYITALELKAGSCTGIVEALGGGSGTYTCTFTPISQAYKTKCIAGTTDCVVPTEF